MLHPRHRGHLQRGLHQRDLPRTERQRNAKVWRISDEETGIEGLGEDEMVIFFNLKPEAIKKAREKYAKKHPELDKQREKLFPMPDYDFSDNRVKVTIVGKVLDVDYAMLLSRDKTLSLLDIEMLSRIQMHRPLNNDEIAYLRKRKLVEGRKNALYFAKSVAGATGQKAEYTRIKGFDDEYYKDLILKALEQHGKLSRPEVNALLMNKLPEALTEKQKLSKIGNLLTYLRKNGKIELLENKMWARKFS